MREIHYQWKQIVDVEGQERLLNVQRGEEFNRGEDFEMSVGELLFDSPENAKKYLSDEEHEEEAKKDNWLLVRTTYETVDENSDALEPNLLLKKIAGRLTGMNKEDLTTAEKQIANLLITQGLLAFDENGDLEEVETN